MARSDEVLAAWAEVDTATTALGARVQVLIDDINRTATEGLNGPQTEAVLSRLVGLRDSLNGMGHNPAAPIPEPPPTEVPMPGPFASR